MKKFLLCILTGSAFLSGALFAATSEISLERIVAERFVSNDLVLYYFPSCPYCQKVIRYLNKSGIAVTLKNIRQHDEYQLELYQLTNNTQVPCLVINGEPMLESNDIIEWLKKNVQSND